MTLTNPEAAEPDGHRSPLSTGLKLAIGTIVVLVVAYSITTVGPPGWKFDEESRLLGATRTIVATSPARAIFWSSKDPILEASCLAGAVATLTKSTRQIVRLKVPGGALAKTYRLRVDNELTRTGIAWLRSPELSGSDVEVTGAVSEFGGDIELADPWPLLDRMFHGRRVLIEYTAAGQKHLVEFDLTGFAGTPRAREIATCS